MLFFYRKFRGGERGTILVLTALLLSVLMGFIGLALDVGTFFHRKRIMQTAADAGALSGGAEILRGQATNIIEAAALAATKENGFEHATDDITVTVNHPPASGYYVDNSQYVEVLIGQPSPTFFMAAFGWNSVQIPARAVAGVSAHNPNCVFALEPDCQGLWVQSSGTLATNCGVIINSTNGCAMDLDSESTVEVEGASISIAGTGWCADSGVTLTPEPETSVPPAVDPLAYLEPPEGGPIRATSPTEITSPTTLSPGVYQGGIKITSSAGAITLNPGIYVMEGGGLEVNGSLLRGTGVMIYNTDSATSGYEPIRFLGSSTSDLHAATEGEYKDVLFYQDPDSVSDVNKGGCGGAEYGDGFILESDSAPMTFDGIFYFPTQRVRIKNKANPVVNNLLVAKGIVIESQSYVDMTGATISGESELKRLTLVE